ncbi:MAG: hypothetical protein AB7O62_07000 [Pirellulales bacterium]
MATATSQSVFSSHTLRHKLSSVRRRMLAVGSLRGLAWGLVGGTLTLLAAVWLDLLWELGGGVRIAAWLAVGAAVAAVLGGIAWRTWQASADGSLARNMDTAARGGGEILTAWDLAGSSADRSGLEGGLAQIAVERGTRLAATVEPSHLAPLSQARRGLLALAAIAAALALAVWLAPELAATEWQRFTHPLGDAPPYSRIQFVVEPGDAQVTYGGELEVHVTTLGPPVERVDIVLLTADGTEETLPMFQENSGGWRAALVHLTESSQYLVRAHGSRSRTYNLSVITVPKIEDARFRLVQPAYARLPPYEGPLPQQGLAGLPGAQVGVIIRGNRPLAAGEIVLFPSAQKVTLAVDAADKQVVSGSFDLAESGRFEVRVTDTEGQVSTEPLLGTLELLEDQRPFVRITEPKPMSLATPDVTLPVVIAAEDDYGLSRMQLFRSLNGSRPMPMDVPLPDQPRRANPSSPLPLSAYGLSPGDTITLFARVEDNDPSGAKGAESAVITVRIISQEEFERMARVRHNLAMLMSKYRQAQRRLQAIAAAKEALKKKLAQQKPSERREAIEQLARKLRQDAAAMRAAAGKNLPYDIDKKMAERLTRLAEALEKSALKAERLSRDQEQQNMSPEDLAQALEQALQELAEGDLEYELAAMQPLELLERLFPLVAAENKFAALYRRQVELAERLSSLSGSKAERPEIQVRMRDLEAEQLRIRQDLAALLDEIEAAAAQLPEGEEQIEQLRESAQKFVWDVRDSGATEAMSAAEAALASLDGKTAHEQALRAAEILKKFLDNVRQQLAGQAGSCMRFKPSLGDCLGQTLEQLLGDMGFGEGTSGNGYSARSGGKPDTGLYGQHPGMDGQDQGGGGSDSAAELGGSNAASNPDDPGNQTSHRRGDARAAGAAAGSIPLRYRRRVSDYLQRIAEETAGE